MTLALRLLGILVLLSSAAASAALDAGQTDPVVPDRYEFPLRPGMEEWRSLRTHDEMIAACQIPPEELEALSTRALALAFLDYPLRIDAMLKSTKLEGMRDLIADFNGLQELFARPDVGSALCSLYCEQGSPASKTGEARADSASDYFRVLYLELALSQPSALESVSADQWSCLVGVAVDRLEAMRDDQAVTRNPLVESTAGVLGRALRQIGFPPFVRELEGSAELADFLEWGWARDMALAQRVEAHGRRFLEE